MRSARRSPKRSASRDAPFGSALTSVEELRGRLLDALAVVAPCDVALDAAIGAVLAADLSVPEDRPGETIALRRGLAVASVETIGASPYAPIALTSAHPVEPGVAIDPSCDAVVAHDAVDASSGVPLVQEAVPPGSEVLPRGRCAAKGAEIAAAGSCFTAAAAFLAEATGIATVAVRRARVLVLHDGSADAITGARGLVRLLANEPARLEIAALDGGDAAAADLVVVLGRGDLAAADPALAWFADHGRIDGGGLALVGCEAVAWGETAGRPTLLLPGRLEQTAIAAAVLVAPLVRRLAGEVGRRGRASGRLARKLVSQIGFTEVAFLRRTATGDLEPLATGRPPWGAVAAADARIELGPGCEGHGEGTTIEVEAMAFASIDRSGATA